MPIQDNTLMVLKLRGSHLYDVEAQVLCEILKHPDCKVEVLGLDSCQLTSACCLGLALTSCQVLQSLNLHWTGPQLGGVELLSTALSSVICSLWIPRLDLSVYDHHAEHQEREHFPLDHQAQPLEGEESRVQDLPA